MKAGDGRFRLWSERPLPAAYLPMLAGIAHLVGCAADTPQEPLRHFPSAQAAIASARLHYDSALMDLNPDLLVIARTGIGVENIDLAEATRRGIAVCNAPEAPTVSTAEMALTLILALARDLKAVSSLLDRGVRQDYFNAYQGLELAGLCLGLVGLGRIGSRVAYLACAIGMRVVAYDPYVPPEKAAALGVALYPTLETVLGEADIVSLHLPATPQTKNLIDAAALACMKPGAMLVNTARGALVDEAALVAALDGGHLRAAALDVLACKPADILVDHPLLHRENVILTPHIASATLAGKERLWRTAIQQALLALQGERPQYLINPEVWEHRKNSTA